MAVHDGPLVRPHNRAFSLGYSSVEFELCGDVSRVAELALCREHELPYWQTLADLFKGLVMARQGQPIEGVLAARRGLQAFRGTGSVVGVTYLLALLAGLHADAGQIDSGLQATDEALALSVKTGNRCMEPEIHRVRGELLLRVDGHGRVARADAAREAARCFRTAIEIARRRSARSLELRAATSLARLWQAQGESPRASVCSRHSTVGSPRARTQPI